MRRGFLLLCLLASPALASEGRVHAAAFDLEGTWWLADTSDGPLRARITVDDGVMDLVPVGQREGGPTWSVSADRQGFEARGPGGAVVRLDPRGADSVLLYAADGRVGLAWRVAPLPASLAGRWQRTDPTDGSVSTWQVMPGPLGEPGRVVVDGRTAEIWPLHDGAGDWSVVLQWADGGADLLHLHALGERWLVFGQVAGRATVLHREGAAPSWSRRGRPPE